MRAYRILCILHVAGSLWLTTGCKSDDTFNFTESDMRSAVVGTWSGPINATNDIALLKLTEIGYPLAEPDAAVSTANQAIGNLHRLQNCGSRQFGSHRINCVGLSTMSIEGSISSSAGSWPASTLRGTFDVGGNDLEAGDLRLTGEQGDTLWANLFAGKFVNWMYATGNDTTFTLDLTRQ
jgi:hypothetical protein